MKSLVRKYIVKQFCKSRRPSQEKYNFLRWLAEKVKDEKETDDVIRTVAYFLSETRLNIPFTDIFLVGKRVYIVTVRPGLWIGRKGETVDKLLKRINRRVDGTVHSDYDVDFIEPKNSAVEIVLNTQATTF